MITVATLPNVEITEDRIRGVEIVARKWKKPGTGESFLSVRVNAFLKYYSRPVELIHIPMIEGSDRDYDKVAMIEWQKIFPGGVQSKSRFLTRYLEEKGLEISLYKTDVKFKKDL